ncbi:phosphoribosylpyrophosphate synthetase [Flavobacterium sp.]|uniref:phosphoribosylpyrophosphate synthetase n=1 Tax=Flavobacterium sp. TaxID=239 RepID=UPI002629C773|nr:phosphoribosylpyrophosphate synthetase [Flavobacterium sp.]MDD3004589.1 phosphoribosylpyrophosphate synthetase [Flavobacterium sp.]
MKELNLNENFGTLSETINALVKLGYNQDFNIKDECIVCHKTNLELSPDDFQIDHVYRFEGDSDPEYQSILYAISSTKFGVKGTLVNGYGISSDEAATKLIAKLNTHHTP